MKKIVFFLLLFVFVVLLGCGRKKIIAGGQRDVIVVLADSNDWEQTKDGLKSALERDVFTPNRETIYELLHGLPENLRSYVYGKNLILIGYLNANSEASKLISTLLTDKAKEMVKNRKAFIFEKNNPWAFGQYLLVIASPGEPSLSSIIQQNKDVIFNYFEKASYERAKWLIYSAGREKDKEDKIKTEFGFSLKLPVGFFWMGEDSIKTFVKLVRMYPYRLISIGWENKDRQISSFAFNDACRMRDSIASLYFDSDVVVREKTTGKNVLFLGREAYKLVGIWKNDEKVMGGVFRTYFFNDTLQHRFYILDMHIFAPGKKKWFYLKELEAVASTFQTYQPGKEKGQ